MNLGAAKSRELAETFASVSADLARTEVWIAPSFTSIPSVIEALRSTTLRVGAQNVHWEQTGAFTGEVSVPMLKELGCQFAIVGHSERRNMFEEPDELVAKRCLGALRQDFKVILCIGETLKERESGLTSNVLIEQLSPILGEIQEAESRRLVLAYEPVWAIGTGKVAAARDIDEIASFISRIWQETAGFACPPILYGGGIDLDNFRSIINVPLIRGALVGGASLSVRKFPALVEMCEQKQAVATARA
jgi:triosephosphate isomerase